MLEEELEETKKLIEIEIDVELIRTEAQLEREIIQEGSLRKSVSSIQIKKR